MSINGERRLTPRAILSVYRTLNTHFECFTLQAAA